MRRLERRIQLERDAAGHPADDNEHDEHDRSHDLEHERHHDLEHERHHDFEHERHHNVEHQPHHDLEHQPHHDLEHQPHHDLEHQRDLDLEHDVHHARGRRVRRGNGRARRGGTFTGITSGASTLTGCVAQTSGAPEQVFQWTPTTSGIAIVETCGGTTAFDTVVYVRTGPCSTGTIIGCNDDTSACTVTSTCANREHHGSHVAVSVTAGTTYYVVVDGYAGSCSGSSGPFTLRIVAP